MATITYTVTVATGTTQYGTGNRYYINGELAPILYLQEGNTYIFDTSDSTNDTHVFAFSTNPNNSPAATYTTGVTTTGTSGQAIFAPHIAGNPYPQGPNRPGAKYFLPDSKVG